MAVALVAGALWLLDFEDVGAAEAVTRTASAAPVSPRMGAPKIPPVAPSEDRRIALETGSGSDGGHRGSWSLGADEVEPLEFRIHTWFRDRTPEGHAIELLHVPPGQAATVGEVVARARTDAGGRALIRLDAPDLPPSDHRDTFLVRVTEPGFMAAEARIGWLGKDRRGHGRARIRPVRGFTRVVRAVDPSGAEIDAKFRIEGQGVAHLARAAEKKPIELLGEGKARVVVVPAPRGQLVASSPAHGAGGVAYSDLHAAGPSDEPFTVVVEQASEISGLLVGAHGDPLAGVRLTLRHRPTVKPVTPSNRKPVFGHSTKEQVVTGEDGTFIVKGLLRGPYTLHVGAEIEEIATVEAFPGSPPVTVQWDRAWVHLRLAPNGRDHLSMSVSPHGHLVPDPGPGAGCFRCLMEPGETYVITVAETSETLETRKVTTTIIPPLRHTAEVFELDVPDDSNPWEPIEWR